MLRLITEGHPNCKFIDGSDHSLSVCLFFLARKSVVALSHYFNIGVQRLSVMKIIKFIA